jgi:large subunit ribosomal protein L32
MPVPTKRSTKRRTNNRRKAPGHQQVKLQFLAICSNCGFKVLPHSVCDNCGFYKGKKILTKLAS